MGMTDALNRISEINSYIDSIAERRKDLTSQFSDILDEKMQALMGDTERFPLSGWTMLKTR